VTVIQAGVKPLPVPRTSDNGHDYSWSY